MRAVDNERSRPGAMPRVAAVSLMYAWAIAFAASWLNPFFLGPAVPFVSWLLAAGAMAACLFAANYRLGDYADNAAASHLFLMRAIALVALLSAAMGLLQFAHMAHWAAPWVSESADGAVQANLRQRNQLATLLVMGMAVLCIGPHRVAWPAATFAWPRFIFKFTLLCALTLLMLCLAATGSRTGALQLVCMVAIFVVMRKQLAPSAWYWALVALALYGVFVLLMPGLAHWVGNSQAGLLSRLDDANAFSRLALWGNVLELIAREPLGGVGWGQLAYAHYSSEFSGPRFMELLDNAHNLPLHVAVELGLPVALAFCALVGWAVWRGKPWAETRPDRLTAWAMLLVMGIHSMVEYPLRYGPFFLTALLCVGVLCGDFWANLWRNRLQVQLKYTLYAMNIIAKSTALILLAVTAFAAFDYHRVSQIYLDTAQRSSWYAADALGAAQRSVLFQSHAKFAELVTTPLSRATAPRVLELASELVLWQPEPRVIEALIESAVMMRQEDLAAFHLKCYARTYPQAYAQWSAHVTGPPI